MTAVPASPRISELRELFRHLSEFRLTFELTGMEEIRTPYGNRWSLWDLEYLIQATERLNLRQRQAIMLCLVHGVREADAAEMMGVSRSNPVAMYATLGIQRLLDMIDCGELERFNKPRLHPRDAALRAAQQLDELARIIRNEVVDVDGCLLFPNRGTHEPRVILRSPASPTGYCIVTPMQVLWMAEVGPVPDGCRVGHSTTRKRVSISCSNPEHGELLMSLEYRERMQRLAAAHTAREQAKRRQQNRQQRISALAEEYIQSLGRPA